MASKYERLKRYRNRSGVSVTVPDGNNGLGATLVVALFVGMLLLLLPFFPPVGIVLGLVAIVFAFRERTEREWIQDSPVEDVESLSLGPSAVTGTVVPVDGESLTAPFTDEPCVVAEWEVDEDRTDGDRRLDGGSDVAPFYVDDGTGTVLVRPDADHTRILFGSGDFEDDGLDLAYRLGIRDPITEKVSVTPGGDAPDAVESFQAQRELGTGSLTREYRQRLVRPGEDVYVFGLVQQRDGERSATNEENLVFQPAPPDRADQEPAFVVSTLSRAKLVARQWWFWIMAGVGGTILLGSLALLVVYGAFLFSIVP